MHVTAIRIIRAEHQALAAVLRTILLLLEQHRRQASMPDFAKLRARTPQLRSLLDQLDQDHGYGERKIRHLEHALLAFEIMGESRRSLFETLAKEYVDFYLAHMAVEERLILPLAEQVLSGEDWSELAEAFSAHQGPLTGHAAEPAYEALFSRIVHLVPAPIGLGEPH